MKPWSLLLAVLAICGCGDSEVRTYRLAPNLQPGYGTCIECNISLTMLATEEGGDGTRVQLFSREAFAEDGFRFQWGVEQVAEIEAEHYDTGLAQDDPGVRYRLLRVLESHPVESGSRFEMKFQKAPPGHYPESFLVREGTGFRLQGKDRIECDTEALCTQLAGYTLGEDAFGLELSYPGSETGHLQLHAIRVLPTP